VAHANSSRDAIAQITASQKKEHATHFLFPVQHQRQQQQQHSPRFYNSIYSWKNINIQFGQRASSTSAHTPTIEFFQHVKNLSKGVAPGEIDTRTRPCWFVFGYSKSTTMTNTHTNVICNSIISFHFRWENLKKNKQYFNSIRLLRKMLQRNIVKGQPSRSEIKKNIFLIL
jgi:hypothetical protein